MTQKEFTYLAGETRAKAVSIAGQFGYTPDDAEDIAQDVMLKLWSLHEQLNGRAHLMASAVITTKRVCIDRWRTNHQHSDIAGTKPLIDEDSLYDRLEYTELEHWIGEQIDSLPSTAGMVLRMRQLEHRELGEIADILGIQQTVDIDIENETSEQPVKDDSEKIKMLPKTVREKPKIVALRWLMTGIAASIVLLAVFHLGRSTAEQPSLVAEKTIIIKDSIQPNHEAITPTEETEEAVIAQAVHAKPQISKRTKDQTANSASAGEDLADCIARLESEMEKLDDSVSSAQVERLIAADARLQEMVYRIVGKQAEEAMNKIQNDSTANYISF